MTPVKVHPCGTVTGYVKSKCRCVECVTAFKAWRARAKQPERPQTSYPHGTVQRYWQGCKKPCCASHKDELVMKATPHLPTAKRCQRCARPWTTQDGPMPLRCSCGADL